MNPDDNQATFRANEEAMTLRRARLLGLEFIDTSQNSDKQLYEGVMDLAEMRKLKVIPLEHHEGHTQIGVTITTPQQAFRELKQQMSDVQVDFAMISESGWREY